MNIRFPLFPICIVFLILLGACSLPQPVLRQVPYKTSGTWYQGREYIIEEGKNTRMVAAYERFEGDKVVFDVEFENTSEQAFLLDPKEFFTIPSDFEFDPYYWEEAKNDILQNRSLPALDPEEMLLQFDKGISRAEARRRNATTVSILSIAVEAATVVAATAAVNNSSDGGTTVVGVGPVFYSDFDDIEAEAEWQKNSLEGQKEYWESYVLRKTTLLPGDKVRGRVYFPATQEAKVNYFFYPVGGEILEMRFEQIVIPAK